MSAGVNSRTIFSSFFGSSFLAWVMRRPTREPATSTTPATMRNGFRKRRLLLAKTMDHLWERRARPLDAVAGRGGFVVDSLAKGAKLYRPGITAPRHRMLP